MNKPFVKDFGLQIVGAADSAQRTTDLLSALGLAVPRKADGKLIVLNPNVFTAGNLFYISSSLKKVVVQILSQQPEVPPLAAV